MLLKKYENNPILSANEKNDWESLCVLNPAAWYEDGIFYLLYRAAGNDKTHYIHLGLAKSTDGFNFERCFDKPVLSPDVNGPDGGCIEDPRLVKFGEYFYLTYAARAYAPGKYWESDWALTYTPPEEGPHFIRRNNTLTHLAISKDLINYKRLGRITDSRLDNRDVILFPEKVNGKYVLLTRAMEWFGEEYGCENPSIWISFSDDMMEWSEHKLLYSGKEWWEDKKVGGSTPPLKTEKGWLTLYHGVNKKDGAYRVGAFLLDLEDPSKIIARTRDFIMEPEFEYETKGYYNSCVFPTGNVIVDGVLYVYYGAADKYCCAATCNVNELLDYLTTDCKV
jgi:predicted GH43/DUF377 family glycosyl hydrolase